jgi:hypothetical protein
VPACGADPRRGALPGGRALLAALVAGVVTAGCGAPPPTEPLTTGAAGCPIVGPYAVPASDKSGVPVGLRLCESGPMVAHRP